MVKPADEESGSILPGTVGSASSLPASSGPKSAAGTDLLAVVDEHYQAVYRYAYRLSGNEPEAEDLTQQAFLVAQGRLHQLREQAKVRAWIFTVVRNCFLKGRRRQRPVAATNLELDVDAVPDHRIAACSLAKLELQQALNAIPDDFRVVLLMYYFEELSYLEIAERLSLPVGTVMSRLSRAKARLRHLLFAERQPVEGRPLELRAVEGRPPRAVPLGAK